MLDGTTVRCFHLMFCELQHNVWYSVYIWLYGIYCLVKPYFGTEWHILCCLLIYTEILFVMSLNNKSATWHGTHTRETNIIIYNRVVVHNPSKMSLYRHINTTIHISLEHTHTYIHTTKQVLLHWYWRTQYFAVFILTHTIFYCIHNGRGIVWFLPMQHAWYECHMKSLSCNCEQAKWY